MSDTPRTDKEMRFIMGGVGGYWKVVDANHSRQLERELNAANLRIYHITACIGDHVAASIAAELANKYAEAMERIKRLEEAMELVAQMRQRWLDRADDGYAGAYYAFVKGKDDEWDAIMQAKEAKP